MEVFTEKFFYAKYFFLSLSIILLRTSGVYALITCSNMVIKLRRELKSLYWGFPVYHSPNQFSRSSRKDLGSILSMPNIRRSLLFSGFNGRFRLFFHSNNTEAP